MSQRAGRDSLLVTAGELAAELAQDRPEDPGYLGDPGEPPVLLDVRWRLAGPPGIDSYRQGHLPGAVFVDLDRDLAGPPGPAIRSAFWLELLAMAVGSTDHRPAIVVGTAPSRLVAFYRSPEGPDLAAVLSSLDMAPIDDVAEPWQALPSAGSERARAVESIVESRGAETLRDALVRLGSVVG